jgi:UDP-glucose:(heptosyl)LPS alpha-1,3-glucosyltransferase
MVRAEIARHFGTPDDRLVLIRNAVDASVFHPGMREELRDAMRVQLKVPREAFVVAHVGSGFERKGVDCFVRALAAAKCAPWGVVVGRDKHVARYVALARKLGVAERIRFVGAVSEVRAYYAAADAFLLATLYDPQPNAALEAMACGLPIVTTPKCGVAELLVEGRSGFVRDALDHEGMADVLDTLAAGDARGMGEAARMAVSRYTPQRMASEYLALYERLLHR